jgi:diguanylate cyclase (GGDEF)-like protein
MAVDGHARKIEPRVQWRNGEIRLVSIEATVGRDPDGRIISLRGTSHDVTQQREMEQRLEVLALRDPLTGLPNRSLFSDRLQQAIVKAQRKKSVFALLFLDLDGFKEVNDTLGHRVGDFLLADVAKRLQGKLRSSDTIARLGGDEFAVLTEDITNAESAEVVADRVCQALKDPFTIEGHELFLTVSVGFALCPEDAQQPEDLLRKADMAMYRSKEAGRNTYTRFNEALTAEANRRMTLIADLRRSRAQGQLHLLYQPQVDLQTGRISGAEALLRWSHPVFGELSPVEFIPLMEETGTIEHIGEWVLRQACEAARAWVMEGHTITIAVNVSFRQLMRGTFAETVRGILSETGLNPGQLEIGLTESTFHLESEHAAKQLLSCREHGVRIAIDDFGTGYSNLGHLRRYLVDNLKIDRSFTSAVGNGGHDTALVKAVVDLARALGLAVIAEGIETEEMAEKCKELGCKFGQGYLFGGPMPETSFRTALHTSRRKVASG